MFFQFYPILPKQISRTDTKNESIAKQFDDRYIGAINLIFQSHIFDK